MFSLSSTGFNIFRNYFTYTVSSLDQWRAKRGGQWNKVGWRHLFHWNISCIPTVPNVPQRWREIPGDHECRMQDAGRLAGQSVRWLSVSYKSDVQKVTLPAHTLLYHKISLIYLYIYAVCEELDIWHVQSWHVWFNSDAWCVEKRNDCDQPLYLGSSLLKDGWAGHSKGPGGQKRHKKMDAHPGVCRDVIFIQFSWKRCVW